MTLGVGTADKSEEPNAAAVALQACLEPIRVWVCCVLLMGVQPVLKGETMGDGC